MTNQPPTAVRGGGLRKGGAVSGGVYESGQYQRVADGLALRRGLTNTLMLGGGAAALSAAIAAAARYSAHRKEHMDEAVQPVGVPLYAGKKRRKPGAGDAAPSAVKSGAAAPNASKPWWMFWEPDRNWNGVRPNTGKPRSEDYGYTFSIPMGIAALAGGGWLGKKLVDRLHGKSRVRRSAEDMADAEADFNQAMYDLTKTSAAAGNAAEGCGAGEKKAVSFYSIPNMLMGLGGMYGAYKLYQAAKSRKAPDPKEEYIRTLARHIARGQFPELAPMYENEFDPEAEIVPAEETGAGASRSGARPAG